MHDASFPLTNTQLYEAAAGEREREATRRTWLRLLKRSATSAKQEARTVIINRPAHLAGPHRL